MIAVLIALLLSFTGKQMHGMQSRRFTAMNLDLTLLYRYKSIRQSCKSPKEMRVLKFGSLAVPWRRWQLVRERCIVATLPIVRLPGAYMQAASWPPLLFYTSMNLLPLVGLGYVLTLEKLYHYEKYIVTCLLTENMLPKIVK